MTIRRTITNNLWYLRCRAERRTFLQALQHVASAQEQVLLELVSHNKATLFGREHDFEGIRSVEDYQAAVPLSAYEDYVPYVDRIRNGEGAILSSDPVRQLHLSSGTSSASKLLPFTRRLQIEFERGLSLWVGDLFAQYPDLRNGSSYWVFTPMNNYSHGFESRVPVGFDQDEDYFGKLGKFFLRNALAVPPEVQHVDAIEDLYYVTLLFLLADKGLRWISVWNPSFITLLLARVATHHSALIQDIGAGTINTAVKVPQQLRRILLKQMRPMPQRARELDTLLQSCRADGALPWSRIWPRLMLISCWADAWAAGAASEVQKLFPGVRIQAKGLLATEGYVTLPYHVNAQALPAPVLAVTIHFYEFRDTRDGRVYLAHELQKDRVYEVVMTTGGGLYRYRLFDLVTVAGFFQQAPCLRFSGKMEMVSDVCGEKLHEAHVQEVLDASFRRYNVDPVFCFFAPDVDNGSARYVLYFDGDVHDGRAEALLNAIDDGLRSNFHYDYCRRLGQLTGPALYLLRPGSKERYIKEKTRQRRLGTLKLSCLEKRSGWSRFFSGTG
ncbi:MAG: GH3 auxin-responsive promoter family protein [Deltaproteobacteria bacterium]|nr:GH3 auxin-responsive promoter family protein [Deltaproteobacteria bacterium]